MGLERVGLLSVEQAKVKEGITSSEDMTGRAQNMKPPRPAVVTSPRETDWEEQSVVAS